MVDDKEMCLGCIEDEEEKRREEGEKKRERREIKGKDIR